MAARIRTVSEEPGQAAGLAVIGHP